MRVYVVNDDSADDAKDVLEDRQDDRRDYPGELIVTTLRECVWKPELVAARDGGRAAVDIALASIGVAALF